MNTDFDGFRGLARIKHNIIRANPRKSVESVFNGLAICWAPKPLTPVAKAEPEIMQNPRVYWAEKPLMKVPKPCVRWV